MINITVPVDDETYRSARIRAAGLDTSVSALVKRYLVELGTGETDFQRLARQERELRAKVPAEFCAADNLTRDQLHDRDA